MLKRISFIFILAATLAMCGCALRTVDEMYAVPARPAADHNFQSAINEAMSGLDYSAPKNGTNQQIVQSVDLDGNGEVEYLLFARGDNELPLRIFIFDKQKDTYTLVDTISCNGTAFDRVEYLQMDDTPGLEILVGCQINDQLTGSLSLYTFHAGGIGQLLSTNYTQFLVTDLNEDSYSELFLIRPGANEWSKGVAEVYGLSEGTLEKSVERNLSAPASRIRRITAGKLHDQINCVYVSQTSSDTTLVTDIFTHNEGELVNVRALADSSTVVETIGNYYVDMADIDGDGVQELPKLVDMVQVTQDSVSSHKIISWYALDSAGRAVQKAYTYHCYVDGWFVELLPQWVDVLTVSKQGKRVDFFSWDAQYGVPIRLFSINVLTGQNREELANSEGYIRLYETANAIFVGEITSNGERYGITETNLVQRFHFIQQDVRNEGM